MSSPFQQIADLDRLVHDPTRLAILTALEACTEADFLFLLNLIGLTKGNLSSHLSKLEEAGWVEIFKTHEGRRPVTRVRLTTQGREGLGEHWRRLDELRQSSRRWRPTWAPAEA